MSEIGKYNEPPVGTWVKDRFGATTYRQEGGGWGQPGMMPLARWEAMWDARGPYTVCGPWGVPLVEPAPVTVEDVARVIEEALVESGWADEPVIKRHWVTKWAHIAAQAITERKAE